MRRHSDLVALVAAAFVCAVAAVLVPVPVISLLFALPLALFLPGYALLLACLDRWRASTEQRLAASVGLSLALLALAELALNYLGGLRAGTWAAMLFAIVLAGAIGAAFARRGVVNAPDLRRSLRTARRRLRARPLSLLAVAVGLVAAGGGVALAFHPVGAKHVVGYSELWLATGKRADAVRVGVGNEEKEATRYGLIARFGDGGKTQTRHLRLAPGATVTVVIPVEGVTTGEPVRVSVTLYREQFPNQPYRRVSGWVPAREGTTP